MNALPNALQVVVTVVENLGLAWLVGAWVTNRWLADAHSAWAVGIRARLYRSVVLAIGLTFITSFITLWIEAAVMAELPFADAGPAIWGLLSETHYGQAWGLGCGTLILMGAVSLSGRKVASPVQSILLALLIALFAYSRSMVSHAADQGDFSLVLTLDWLHVLLISLWVGEVLVAGLLVLPAFHAEECLDQLAAAFVSTLSRTATFTLMGVLLTGLAKAWLSVGTVNNLIGNLYGEALMIKLALVVLAVGLGGFNRFFVLPSLLRALSAATTIRADLMTRFRLILQIESVVLVAVMIAAAVLSASPTPVSL